MMSVFAMVVHSRSDLGLRKKDESEMDAERKVIEALGWHAPAERSALDFCLADAELLPVVFKFTND